MINIQDLRYRYNETNDIRFKDWSIQAGEHWLMTGRSGSGKTTLLHILSGLLAPTHGTVTLADQNLYQLSAAHLDRFRGRHIGLVFQRPHLIKSLNVLENLLIAQSFPGLKTDRARIESVLRELELDGKLYQYPGELSQGQLQRVSIARAVVNHPSVIVADEPTSSLDDQNAQTVLKLLTRQAILNKATLVIATHDQRVKRSVSLIYEL